MPAGESKATVGSCLVTGAAWVSGLRSEGGIVLVLVPHSAEALLDCLQLTRSFPQPSPFSSEQHKPGTMGCSVKCLMTYTACPTVFPPPTLRPQHSQQ